MQGWQDIHTEALRRIQSREWTPGDQIPKEAELAAEFGCARATVNRALQALADDGWLERRRRAGTRVALSPQRRAQMVVPVLRQEVESLGKSYTHKLLQRDLDAETLHLCGLHLADGMPYAVEDRQINLTTVPAAAQVDFTTISANEWLVQNAPFESGTMAYSADAAEPFEATHLQCPPATALLVLARETHCSAGLVTRVRTAFAPQHRVHLNI